MRRDPGDIGHGEIRYQVEEHKEGYVNEGTKNIHIDRHPDLPDVPFGGDKSHSPFDHGGSEISPDNKTYGKEGQKFFEILAEQGAIDKPDSQNGNGQINKYPRNAEKRTTEAQTDILD